MAGLLTVDSATDVETAIADGGLTGFTVTPLPRIAVADAAGCLRVPRDRRGRGRGQARRGAHGLAAVPASTSRKSTSPWRTARGGHRGRRATGKVRPHLITTIWMPGHGQRVPVRRRDRMVHVLGTHAGRLGATRSTSSSPRNAVFADAGCRSSRPPGPSTSTQAAPERRIASDPGRVAATGQLATVDIGQQPFAWRFPGSSPAR